MTGRARCDWARPLPETLPNCLLISGAESYCIHETVPRQRGISSLRMIAFNEPLDLGE